MFSRYDAKNSYITIINNTDKEIDFTFSNLVYSLLNGEKSAQIVIEKKTPAIIKAVRYTHLEF